jgi:Flp pilus assembly protein TadD
MDRYTEAANLMESGHPDQAVATWQSLVHDDPGFVDPYLRLSEYYIRMADPEHAAAVFGPYLKDHAATPEIKLDLAEALVRMPDRPKALTAAQSAVQANPDSARAHMALSAIYLQLNDSRGVPEILRAEQLDPQNANIWLLAAQIYKDLQEPARVEDQVRTAMTLDPNNPEMLYLLGWALAEQPSPANLTNALVALQRSVQLNPKGFSCWVEIGAVLEKQHQYAEAIEPLQTACALGGIMPPGMQATHDRLQERITADHLLLEAYQRTGREAMEPPVREDAERLQTAVQALLREGVLK